MSICFTCAAPIHFSTLAGSWLHNQPLACMRVSHLERDEVLSAAPDRFRRKGRHHPNLHPALPRRS